VNLESYTARTAEVKRVLLEGYKKLYAADLHVNNNPKKPNLFEKEVLATLNKNISLASKGIDAESLMVIRTRFVLEWFQGSQAKFPFRLFDHYQQLLKEGIFDAYNQWIFGDAANTENYEAWKKAHPTEAEGFKKFQTARIFKMPLGQNYK
jgi:hypothetical protein